MIPYFASTDLISKQETEYLESLLPQGDFVEYDTISGSRDGNLCWDKNINEFNKFNLKSYTFFVHQPGYTKVTAHVDNTKWKRNTVLIVPLHYHKHYAPCYFTTGPQIHLSTPYLFNTQLEHYINNNNHDRYNFQICFEEPIEEVAKCLTLR